MQAVQQSAHSRTPTYSIHTAAPRVQQPGSRNLARPALASWFWTNPSPLWQYKLSTPPTYSHLLVQDEPELRDPVRNHAMISRVIRTTSIASAGTTTTLIAGTAARTRTRTRTDPSRPTRPVAPLARAPVSTSRLSPATSIANMSSFSTGHGQPTTTPANDESRNPGDAPQPPAAQDQQQEQEQEHQQQHPAAAAVRPDRALPAPGDNGGDGVTTLDVGGQGSTVKLDVLGPLVVNQNGTVSRIGNWAQMTDLEQQNTLRILGKRNQTRLAALRARGEGLDMSGEKNRG